MIINISIDLFIFILIISYSYLFFSYLYILLNNIPFYLHKISMESVLIFILVLIDTGNMFCPEPAYRYLYSEIEMALTYVARCPHSTLKTEKPAQQKRITIIITQDNYQNYHCHSNNYNSNYASLRFG